MLVLRSEPFRLPADESEDEDSEVTNANGDVCTFGGSTAKSASMRKFLDFSIWFVVQAGSVVLGRLGLFQTVVALLLKVELSGKTVSPNYSWHKLR